MAHVSSSTDGFRADVTDYGAVGDGVADDRAAIQRAVDAVYYAGGGTVYIPDGTYRVTRSGTTGYCLLLKSRVRIEGETQAGAILKQAASIAASVRLFYATNAVDAELKTLTLDGNKAAQTVNEHRHGIFIDGVTDLVLDNVLSQNFTGDGFYVYLDSSKLTFRSCTATNNDRSGITIGRTCNDVLITGCTLTDNGAQEIDFEPGTTDSVHDIRIIGNTLGSADDPDDYALAIGGTSSDGIVRDVLVRGNTIYGGVNIVWAADVVFTGNTVTVSQSNVACVKVYRNCSNVKITHNELSLTREFNSADEHAGVFIDATGVGNQPDEIVLSHNTITLSHPNLGGPTIGVLVRGALSLTAEYNTITGAGGTAGANYDGGFLLRGSVAGGPWAIRHNTIRNIGTKGVLIYDVQTVSAVDVSYNDIDDTQAIPTMTIGVDLYDSTANVTSLTCIDNTIGEAIATAIDYPPSGYVLTDYTPAGNPVYTGEIIPESNVAAPLGSVFIKVNTSGVVTAVYSKTNGATATGWTLVS